MLDKSLVLNGILNSTIRTGDTTTSMSLPLKIKVTKTLIVPPAGQFRN